MQAGYRGMVSMMGGAAPQATVPTQTFSSANFIGTAVPQVGDNAGRPPYANAVGATNPQHVAIAAVIIIGVGYLIYHFNFEK